MAPRGTISFRSLHVPDAFRDRTRLRRWLNRIAKDHGHSIHEVTYVLMDDKELLGYNQRYLGHDAYTDIITFDLQTGTGISGDILISYDRVKENARTFGVSARHELHRVMVHGLLHLLGFRDKTAAQRRAMRDAEDACLALLS